MTCIIHDIPINYEEYGEGKPVLCIHGYWVDHRLMSECLEPVFDQKHGYRRIYIDLPGMGKTPSAEWIKDSYDVLGIVKEFINVIIADENFLIAGESYGGYLTLGIIYDMCERIDGVMLICPVVANTRKNLPLRNILHKSEALESIYDKNRVKTFLEIAVMATTKTYEKYKSSILAGIEIADMEFLSELYDKAFDFENKFKDKKFCKPACILTGRQDHLVGYKDTFEILDKFPRATFAVLDCSGHNLQIENELLFNDHVKDWIWRVELEEMK